MRSPPSARLTLEPRTCGQLGHTVAHTASDGEELLRILIHHADDIDVAFVDIRLPKLFGDAAVAQYRSWERENCSHRPPLRIYATSGDATSSMVQQLEMCGFDGTVARKKQARNPASPLALSVDRAAFESRRRQLAKPVYPEVYRQLCSTAGTPPSALKVSAGTGSNPRQQGL